MDFFNKTAFLFLFSIPIIVIMYLFKRKNKEIKVSSTYLWKMIENRKETDKSLQKIKNDLLMILQIITAFLLILSLANPFVKANSVLSENYIILLDSSMSMAAMDYEISRFEEAKNYIKSILNSSSPQSKFTIIKMDNSPSIVINKEQNKNDVIEKLNNITCSKTDIDYNEVENIINMLNSESDSEFYLFSDDDYNIDGIDMKKVIFGKSSSNTAITSLSHSIDEDKINVLVKVRNYGLEKVNKTVNLYTDNKIYDYKEIEINPNEEKDIIFNGISSSAEEIMASISPEDILSIDDVRYNIINKNENLKIFFVSKNNNIFLDNILSVIPNIEYYKNDADNLDVAEGYNLYIFDGIIPEKMPLDGHILLFNPPYSNEIIDIGEEEKINNIIAHESSVFNFIKDLKFNVLKSKTLVVPSWGTEILSSDKSPIIIAGEKNNQKIVVCGFDLHDTDLPLKKEFPIFMYNMIKWFIPETPIENDDIKIGDIIEFDLLADIEQARVIKPDNEVILISPPFPASSLVDTYENGIYLLEQKNNTNTYFKFAVNAGVNQESNLIRENLPENSINESFKNIKSHKSLKNIICFILMFLLFVEWWVYIRNV